MAKMVRVVGAEKVRNNMRNADKVMAKDFRRGLAKAGLFLQRESQKVVPVKYGNLKNSAGTELVGSGWKSDAIVYYTATYAVYVHERTDLQHKEGKQAKFLEGPANEHRLKILQIIAGETGKGNGGAAGTSGTGI